MSVEQPTVVDGIGTNKETGLVHLTISDHLVWNRDHLVMLQDKLNAYLEFIESGQIHADYPDAKGRSVVIDLVIQHRPNEEGTAFLAKAASVVEQIGLRLKYGPLPSGYANDNG